MSSVHCLPFDLEIEALAAHRGLSRCSVTAQELWLTILDEAFCTGSIHLQGLNAIAARLGIRKEALYSPLNELITRRVCSVTRGGWIQPIDAEYLQADFWARLQERTA